MEFVHSFEDPQLKFCALETLLLNFDIWCFTKFDIQVKIL